MDETEILTAVKRELDRAESFIDGSISIERAAAYDYYYGRPFGNEQDGRSQVVSADVAQSVDSALPALMKIFVSGDKAVEFTPRMPEDVNSAEQATIGCNYVFFTQNNGYALAHDFLKDGLLQKTGVFKWKWDEHEKSVEKRLSGLDDLQFQMVAQQVEASGGEIAEHSEYPGPMGLAHDVLIRTTKKEGRVKVVVPAPEEVLVSPDAEGLDVMEFPFIAHKCRVTRGDLLAMGYKSAVIDELPKGDDEDDFLKDSRDTTEGEAGINERDREHYVYNECYMRLPTRNGGKDELHKVCIVGNTILHDEVTDHIPISIWSPKVMPHEVIGQSLADEVMDIQLIKSTIWRGALDNLYLTIAPRMFVQGDVNLDDAITVKPGGLIRGEAGSNIVPIATPSLIGDAFSMMEYVDQEEESRTGISRMFQGIDPQAINKTATGVTAMINQANARVEMMARNAAEFGFKPLFKGILYLLAKHQSEQLIVRVTNSFTPIEPDAWEKEYDMTCNVGLGTGTKDQQLMHLQALGMDLQAIAQTPFAQQLLDAKKIYNYVQEKAELMGFKDASVFVNDPEGTQPPPPPKPPEVQVAEIEAQTSMQKAQVEQQGKGQELMAKGHLETQRMQQESALKEKELLMEAELERYKAELKAQTELQVAQIREQLQHEREMRRVDVEERSAGRPQNVISIEDREGALKGAADQLSGHGEALNSGLAMMAQAMAELRDAMSRPKTIVRGKDGRAVGVQ